MTGPSFTLIAVGTIAGQGWLFRMQNAKLFCPWNRQDSAIEQFIALVDSYIRQCNEKRIKISYGSLGPIKYRASLGFSA